MNKILCSTGAIIGRINGNDHKLLKDFAEKLDCDGFELMIHFFWYSDLMNIIDDIKSYGFYIPVVHADKALGETLSGVRTVYVDRVQQAQILTPEEDAEFYRLGTERLKLHLQAAEKVGADKIVLHLWNGPGSDKNIEKNIERFALWKELADKEGIQLLAENVVCNTHDPLSNMVLLNETYPDIGYVYDTKMAEFHDQTMKLFDSEYEWMIKDGRIKHLHINDYSGGYMDWANMKVLPIGEGHVNFESFFKALSRYGYTGDYTVEATAFIWGSEEVKFDMLNDCFAKLRTLRDTYICT